MEGGHGPPGPTPYRGPCFLTVCRDAWEALDDLSPDFSSGIRVAFSRVG